MTSYKGAEHTRENANVEAIITFFQEPGAIEVISMLAEDDYRLDDLDDELDVNRAYINNRLTDGQALQLTSTREARPTEDGERYHRLSTLGEWFATRLDEIGLTTAHQELRAARNRFDAFKTEFKQWTSDTDAVEAHLDGHLERILQSELHERADFSR